MARNVGSWWINDGIDGRRLEAQGFAELLGTLPWFAWTEDHGDSGVAKSDFVTTAGTSLRSDKVDLPVLDSRSLASAGIAILPQITRSEVERPH